MSNIQMSQFARLKSVPAGSSDMVYIGKQNHSVSNALAIAGDLLITSIGGIITVGSGGSITINGTLSFADISPADPVPSEIVLSFTGNGSATFDPVIITSRDCVVSWTVDGGSRTLTGPGTTHTISYVPTTGPHTCAVATQYGLDPITSIDCNTDSVVGITNTIYCKNLARFAVWSNLGLVASFSQIPYATYISAYNCRLLSGKFSELSRQTTFLDIGETTLPRGLMSDLPSTFQTGYFHYTAISACGVAGLIGIRLLWVYQLGWTQQSVDLVLLSISDAIHQDVAHFSYATPSLKIHGTNAAPSGAAGIESVAPTTTPGIGNSDSNWFWDADKAKHRALSGRAAIWVMRNNVGHVWTVTATDVT